MDLRVELQPSFQKELFGDLIAKYSSEQASLLVCISRGMLYHYKNLRVRSISFDLLYRVAVLLDMDIELILSHTIRFFSDVEERNSVLAEGRLKRIKQLRQFKENLCKPNEMINNNILDVERWLESYLPLKLFELLSFIASKPYLSVSGLGKALKMKRLYPKTRILFELGYVKRESCPYRYSITKKGAAELRRGGKDT